MEAIFTRGNASDDTLGGRISLARDTVGLTMEEVARTIGVEADTLRYWENDQAEPGVNRLSMLAGVLQVSLSWLLSGFGDGPDWAGFIEVPPLAPRHIGNRIPPRH